MSDTNKTIGQLKEELHKKHGTANNTFDMFPVEMRVKIISPCVDFQYFYGEIGKVVSNSGRYLGIGVQLDEPRQYQDGTMTTGFNFNPIDLIVLGNKETLKLKRFKGWWSSSCNGRIHRANQGPKLRQEGWVAAMKEVRAIIVKQSTARGDSDNTHYCIALDDLDEILKQEIGGETKAEDHHPDFNPKK